ncbi:MAG: hypothetical protein A2268_15285 [Candidatus Raymondbacteria bacterium RifOxyA12_full_50_37]|uniref:Polymerase beta nucleotidyltransferase domain-containing protein n=1 Tax=Candidatus Raymondbacteria bacterium RIFOXYD12_FULL_49_13 TaxID=1817890 RepID=A0A1F7F759_UNCRA|nr:MAG: hypothetical protein A2268_15285 [Candidatus Raymondbacteria bacterium RifOxyA12_full_50_37]OGJ88483.1 MAG: hypothetical protein A2248_19980 [Candidatus Raymondbacteria bacterium RIFOXYA2_FULL_49_16]OGJ90635.1 MAG: hypothetical protein A2350_18535 [Candidatus Raymondbacteria bacterium RifOxyB12_full_50_8]OGJ96205.1 MAG: hypothetical protein A2487_01465 [Candidatus Raymondbacteria bacterium RifOxyC12_full_50_8]OGJ98943.1 MAG: hypothetical protein A2453_10695 [Candidatus Raymondbacteria b
MSERTVLELDDIGRKSYSDMLANHPLKAASPQMVERAKAVAREMAAFLSRDYGAKKVWLFGSLANGAFSAVSDLDIAYQGIEPSFYFRVYARISEMFQPFNVDLVDVDDCRPDLLREILEKGIIL